MYSDTLGKSGIKQINFYDFQRDLLLELEKIDIVNKCFLYDAQNLEDMKTEQVNTRDGKFVNLYIDYKAGQHSKDLGNSSGIVNELASFNIYIVGKKDVNKFDDRFRSTSSICYEAKQKIVECLDDNYINKQAFFPAELGDFFKLMNEKSINENISIYSFSMAFKINSYVRNK